MIEVDDLQSRIDAEFSAAEQRTKSFQNEAVEVYEGRKERLKTFEKTCEDLRAIWQPKLEALSNKFGDQVKVTPKFTKELRQARFDFETRLAHVQLRFSASTDTDVRKLVLDYNLDILPILMAFERHSQVAFPLENIDKVAVGKWIDDRIVEFVRNYLALYQNEHYLKDHMVCDPIAQVSFPKFAAAATLERNGKKLFFISEKTCEEFEKTEKSTVPATKGS